MSSFTGSSHETGRLRKIYVDTYVGRHVQHIDLDGIVGRAAIGERISRGRGHQGQQCNHNEELPGGGDRRTPRTDGVSAATNQVEGKSEKDR
jgi:hypothetical protein